MLEKNFKKSKVYYKECECEFCGKKFNTQNGKNGHIRYCKLNPNKKEAWNKGLKSETNKIVQNYTQKSKETKSSDDWKKNHSVWNKGLTKETSSSVKKYAIKQFITKNKKEWKQNFKDSIYEKYKGKHWMQIEEFKEKYKKAIYSKYGVYNVMEVASIYKKASENRYLKKDYIFPSGKIVKVQGYEPYAIDFLLNDYPESDIITDAEDMPFISYEQEGKIHRYYPDIYIKSENKIIEVKSVYTIKDNIKKNILKYKAVISAGFKFECWIINNRKLEEKIYDLQRFYENVE